ncbi:AAA family ATPase, partial [Streptomyces sp. NPDC000151]|uniref:AAA family ATPase n=1 Tax=Streptomyces sp. NPDC000151 TaxID=3154244 RepID=UPI0033238314
MHLKSLTLRGFKSFASATTLRFEPGITCVVGPNGSGKSNVVDALSWVMGEQGAKSLRGGKMEDVIFAGTTGRPPLGRAEVSLTIDNSDGALPIEYAEVTITRIMFRNGGSEYQLNGDTCRLLDIQELLSDSGIGREMHVIVGQGQLDGVLHADPMGRRAFIEEAAGVLKHRKRKEKALRKLDAMQANLARVQDLTDELRRQLKPLGRQAAVARRAAVIQADLRDARLRLLADDLVTLREALRTEIADEAALKQRREATEAELKEALRREAALEEEVRTLTPRLQRAQQTWYELSQLAERVRGTISLADARVKSAQAAPPEERRGRDPEEMEREAARIREQEAELEAALEAATRALDDMVEHRSDLERQLQDEERRLRDAARAIADRREGLARLHGQVTAARGRAASAQAEIDRLAESRDAAQARAEAAQQEYEQLKAEVDGLDAGDEELAGRHERAKEELAAAERALTMAREALTSAERKRAATAARHDALALGLRRKDGTGALLAAADRLGGLLGPAAELLTVQPGYEIPVAAALGAAADAIAVADPATAAEAIRLLRKQDAGRAVLLPATPAEHQLTGAPAEHPLTGTATEHPLTGTATEHPLAGTVGERSLPGSPRDTALHDGATGPAGTAGADGATDDSRSAGGPGGASYDERQDSTEGPAIPGARSGPDAATDSSDSSELPGDGAVVASVPAARTPDGSPPAAAELVDGPAELLPAVRRLLRDIVVVSTLEDAEDLVAARPGVTAVTAEGDLLGAHFAQGGSAGAPSLLEVQASVDEAAAELTELAARCEQLAEDQRLATERRAERAALVEELAERRRAADREKSQVAQSLGRLGGQARGAVGEAERSAAAVAKAEEALARATEEAEELAERLAVAEEDAASSEGGAEEPDTAVRDRLAADGANARQTEMEARLQVRTHEERVKGLAGRADGLDRAARAVRDARA